MGSEYLIFVSAFVSGFCALLLTLTNEKYKKALATFIFVSALASAFGALQSTKEAEIFNKKMFDSVMGSNGFIRATLLEGDKMGENPRIAFVPNGEYTIYDVSLNIVDLDKLDKSEKTFEGAFGATDSLRLGNFTRKSIYIMPDWSLSGKKETYRYDIYFVGRNASWSQKFRIRKINNKWTTASRILKDTDDILYEKIDPEYPRDEIGNVVW